MNAQFDFTFCVWDISCAVYKFQLIDDLFHIISLSHSHSIDVNIFWENWIPTDLHIALIGEPCLLLKISTANWRARNCLLTELTLSFGAYCHTMWWNDSSIFCVLHFSTETKKSFFIRRSKNGLMTSTTAFGNGFLIGLWNELPVATSLWKLHQLAFPGGQLSCGLSWWSRTLFEEILKILDPSFHFRPRKTHGVRFSTAAWF